MVYSRTGLTGSVALCDLDQNHSLTFALVGGVDGQGVAIEGVLAAVAEEAGGVVDALEALSCLPVAVADSVGVDVVAAFAGPAGPDRPALAQRVAKEAIVTELAAFSCRQVRRTNRSAMPHDGTEGEEPRYLRQRTGPRNQVLPVVPAGQLVHTTSLVFRTTAQVAPMGQGQG